MVLAANANLKTSTNGRLCTQKSEGCSLRSYRGPGEKYWTVGYGHYSSEVKPNTLYTLEQCQRFFLADITHAEDIVKELVEVPLNQGQFDALVDFVFNLGPTNFRTSRLLKLLNKGLYSAVPGQLKLWVLDGARRRAQGLVNRRNHEIWLWNGLGYPGPCQAECHPPVKK